MNGTIELSQVEMQQVDGGIAVGAALLFMGGAALGAAVVIGGAYLIYQWAT